MRHVDITTSKVISQWKLNKLYVMDMVTDPADILLANGCGDGSLIIFDIKKAAQTHFFSKVHRGGVRLVRFHPKPEKLLLFSTGDDCLVKVHDLIVSTCVFTFNGHTSYVSSLLFSFEGSKLLSIGYDHKLNLWDLKSHKLIKHEPVNEETHDAILVKLKYEGGSKADVSFFLFSVDENGVITASIIGGKEIKTQAYEQLKGTAINRIQFLKKSKRLVCVTQEQNICFFSLALAQGQDFPSLNLEKTLVGNHDDVIDCKFSRQNNGKFIAVATNSPNLKISFPPSNSHLLLPGHSNIIMALDTINDLVLSASKDTTLKLWRLSEDKSYTLLATFMGHTASVTSCAIAAKTLSFIVSVSNDKTLKMWDIEQILQNRMESELANVQIKNALRTVIAHQKDINACKIAPNETMIASSSLDKSIKVQS
jgi:U3 small nucleolar RNA-associated protein 13